MLIPVHLFQVAFVFITSSTEEAFVNLEVGTLYNILLVYSNLEVCNVFSHLLQKQIYWMLSGAIIFLCKDNTNLCFFSLAIGLRSQEPPAT